MPFPDHIWSKTRSKEAMTKIKFNFFLEITKGDHKLSITFYFIKISHVLTELWMDFCLVWHFAAKTLAVSGWNSRSLQLLVFCEFKIKHYLKPHFFARILTLTAMDVSFYSRLRFFFIAQNKIFQQDCLAMQKFEYDWISCI